MILRNSTYNLVGQAVPALVGLFIVPILIQRLGLEKFGVLTFVWMFVGYLGFLDLGISKALTIFAAKERDIARLRSFIWGVFRGLIFLTLLFSLFASLVLMNAPDFLDQMIPVFRSDSAKKYLLLLMLTLPALILSSAIRGVLEARLQFFRVSLMQSLVGSLNFFVPFCVALFTVDLFFIILSVSVLRYISLVGYFVLLPKEIRTFSSQTPRVSIFLLLRGSGWIGAASFMGALLAPLDRLILSAVVPSASLFAQYSIASEMAARLAIFPSSLGRVLVPLHSSNAPAESWGFQLKLLGKACPFYFLIAFIGWFLTPFFFQIWLKGNATDLLVYLFRIMLAGFFFNALSWHFFDFLQSRDRSRLVALAHIVELPIYAISLGLSAKQNGVEGVAWVYLARHLFDFLILSSLGYLYRDK